MDKPIQDKPKKGKEFSDGELMVCVMLFVFMAFILSLIGFPSNWSIVGAAIGTIVVNIYLFCLRGRL